MVGGESRMARWRPVQKTYDETTTIQIGSFVRVQTVSEVQQASRDVLVPYKSLVKVGVWVHSPFLLLDSFYPFIQT